jgi:hypothetical protein
MQINQPKATKSNMGEQILKWCKLARGTEAKRTKISRSKTRSYLINKIVIFHIKVKVKVEVKITLEQAMKSQMGSRGIALLFL